MTLAQPRTIRWRSCHWAQWSRWPCRAKATSSPSRRACWLRSTSASGQKLLPANPADVLEGGGADRGGYVDLDGDANWWIPSGRMFYSPGSRRHRRAGTGPRPPALLPAAPLPRSLPHGSASTPRRSSPTTTTTCSWLETLRRARQHGRTPQNDYRVLQPRLMTDPNGNRSEVAFDALGMVVATAVMGKPGENLGDLLEDFDRRPAARRRCKPSSPIRTARRRRSAGQRDDPHRLRPRPLPAQPASRRFAATLARETHVADPGRRADRKSRSASPTPTASAARSRRRSRPSAATPAARPDVTLPSGDDHRRALMASREMTPCNRCQPALGRQRLDGVQQQGQAGPPVRAVLHRHPSLRELDVTTSASARCCSTIRSSASSPRCTPTTPGKRSSSTRGGRRPGTSTTPCWSPIPKTDADVRRLLPPPAGRRLPAHLARLRTTSACGALERSGREQAAADKARRPRGTRPPSPTLDTLGRTFLTVAHNRFEHSDAPVDRTENYRHPRRPRHRRQPARSHRRQGPRRHALRLRHARQPHPPGQHGGGRALDAERRGRQADPRLGQPRPPVPHRLRPAAPADGLLSARRRRRASC